MTAQRSPQFPFDSSILDQLACPACMGNLDLNADALHCAACGRRYPIVDGIPVLIVERADAGGNG
jgi:uncharacterized protein YbaR (Trm112 family)